MDKIFPKYRRDFQFLIIGAVLPLMFTMGIRYLEATGLMSISPEFEAHFYAICIIILLAIFFGTIKIIRREATREPDKDNIVVFKEFDTKIGTLIDTHNELSLKIDKLTDSINRLISKLGSESKGK